MKIEVLAVVPDTSLLMHSLRQMQLYFLPRREFEIDFWNHFFIIADKTQYLMEHSSTADRNSMGSHTLTEAAFANALDRAARRYTDSDRESALIHLIDGIGAAYAGYQRREIDRLLGSSIVTVASHESAWLIGHHLRSRPSDAVLMNAMAAHLDDFDDDETQISIAHVTVPTMAATLAAASMTSVSGQVVLDSFLSGVETIVALGELLNPEHYRLGWHATATLGVFGAAMATAHVLGLSPDRKATALAFAMTACSGTRSAFGSSAKSWQVAASSRDGFNAALLAKEGFDATPSLFGRMGLTELYGGDLRRVNAVFGRVGHGSPFKDPGVTIKAYPCCTAAHTTMEACEIIRSRLAGRSWREISSVVIRVSRSILSILVPQRPTTALEGKFSMQFCAAVALCLPSVGLGAFTDDTIANPSVQHIMERVEVYGLEEQMDPFPSHVEVTLSDGSSFSKVIEQPRGSPERPCTRDDIYQKFESLCQGADTDAALKLLYRLPVAENWTSFEAQLSSLLKSPA